MLGPLTYRPLFYHHFPQLWILCLCDFSVEKYCLTGGTGGWLPGTCEEKSGKRPNERSVQKKKISTKWTAFPAGILACAESRGCWNKWARLIQGEFCPHFPLLAFLLCGIMLQKKTKNKKQKNPTKNLQSLKQNIFQRWIYIYYLRLQVCGTTHQRDSRSFLNIRFLVYTYNIDFDCIASSN